MAVTQHLTKGHYIAAWVGSESQWGECSHTPFSCVAHLHWRELYTCTIQLKGVWLQPLSYDPGCQRTLWTQWDVSTALVCSCTYAASSKFTSWLVQGQAAAPAFMQLWSIGGGCCCFSPSPFLFSLPLPLLNSEAGIKTGQASVALELTAWAPPFIPSFSLPLNLMQRRKEKGKQKKVLSHAAPELCENQDSARACMDQLVNSETQSSWHMSSSQPELCWYAGELRKLSGHCHFTHHHPPPLPQQIYPRIAVLSQKVFLRQFYDSENHGWVPGPIPVQKEVSYIGQCWETGWWIQGCPLHSRTCLEGMIVATERKLLPFSLPPPVLLQPTISVACAAWGYMNRLCFSLFTLVYWATSNVRTGPWVRTWLSSFLSIKYSITDAGRIRYVTYKVF